MKKLLLLILLFSASINAAEDGYEIVDNEIPSFSIQNNTDIAVTISFKPNDLVYPINIEPNEVQTITLKDETIYLIYTNYFSQIKEFWVIDKRRFNQNNTEKLIKSSNMVKIAPGKNYVVTEGRNNQLKVTKE